MLAYRALSMRSALCFPAQVRTISLARIALEPAKKIPPPPPPPTKGSAAAAKAKVTATKVVPKVAPKAATKTVITIKKTAVPIAATKVTLTAKEKEKIKATALKDKEKEKEREKARVAREKLREKNSMAREKEKEKKALARAKLQEKVRAQKERAKEREKAKKERDQYRLERSKAIQKPYAPPPKQPVSAYIRFMRDPTVDRQRGETITADAPLTSKAWKSLTDAQREAYQKEQDAERVQYKEKLAKWVSSLNLAQLQAARLNHEPGTRDGAALDVLPKRPGNGYSFFLRDVVNRSDFKDNVEAKVQKDTSGTDIKKLRIGMYGRTAGDMWKTMPEREKAAYVTKSEDAKKKWAKTFGSIVAAQKEAIAAAHP